MKSSNWKGIVVVSLAFLIFTVGLVTTLPSDTPILSEGTLMLENAFPSLSFSLPVDLQNANDGSNRFFLVEKSGIIRVFNNSPDTTSSLVFLDISSIVSSASSEMGLLGLAFHPEYQTNGYFFVDYTADSPQRTIIARYQVDANNPNLANASSAEIILEVAQPYTNHNAGQIAFGPDGYLYITMGDGGSSGDLLGHGQNRSTLLGSILRIDVDNPGAGTNYGIPLDNPFEGNIMGYAEEIFAYGLRNPWRFSFDSETGDLWLGDVGQYQIEEIDLIQNGGNYGWNLKEGSQCYAVSECDSLGLIDPVWEYNHSVGSSITGGYVYRGSKIPSLYGKYLYGDFISGRIWSLEYDGINTTNNTELFDTSLSISSFGMDKSGEIYALSYDGTIYTFMNEVSTTSTTPTSTTSTNGETFADSFTSTSTSRITRRATTEPDDLGPVDFPVIQLVVIGGLVTAIILILVQRVR